VEIKANKQQITNMQSNSAPKLDISKTFIFFPFQKKIHLPPKKIQLKTFYQISFISPPFCHVLTKITQSEGRQKKRI